MSSLLPLSRHVQFVSVCGLTCLLLGVLAPWGRVEEATTTTKPPRLPNTLTTTKPGAKAGGNVPLYVGAYSVDQEFEFVTEECMKIIRSKKVLFKSRSWGLGLGTIMGSKDKKYELVWESHSPERVNDKKRVLKPDAFDQPKIVHYVFDMVPKRWAFLDDFLRKHPWKFGGKIDGSFQSLYCGPRADGQGLHPPADQNVLRGQASAAGHTQARNVEVIANRRRPDRYDRYSPPRLTLDRRREHRVHLT
jgi:hypothetical protein